MAATIQWGASSRGALTRHTRSRELIGTISKSLVVAAHGDHPWSWIRWLDHGELEWEHARSGVELLEVASLFEGWSCSYSCVRGVATCGKGAAGVGSFAVGVGCTSPAVGGWWTSSWFRKEPFVVLLGGLYPVPAVAAQVRGADS
ncbi:hypothetical protein Drorol1_Dr00022436 [Drosera rotundifolia]